MGALSDRARGVLVAALGLALFVVALALLRLELRAVSWHELVADVAGTSWWQLALALAFTALSYLSIVGYDLLAFAAVRRPVSRRDVAGVALVAAAISNNIGVAMLSGASVRYRAYSRWGLGPGDLARIAIFYAVTFWLGLLALGGASLAMADVPAAAGIPMSALRIPIGAALMAAPVAYVLIAWIRQSPIRVHQFELPVPSPAIAAAQLLVSALDWLLAGAVLYVLLPEGAVPFASLLGVYLLAVLLGMVSHVPGGLGVFEGLVVLLLKPYLDTAEIVPALVVYRAVYYLLPLTLAMLALVAGGAWRRRAHVERLALVIGRLADQLTPKLLAVGTFLAGLVLLFSGATPAVPARLARLHDIFPLGVIETSHFVGSVIGVALLILSQGLARRLDAAFVLTALAMVAGMVTSLLKGFDYEEAALLAVVLALLWRARQAFDRRAAFFDTWFSPAWVASVAGAILASVWLGLFAFQHVEYSQQLWWQFELTGDVSRFLRASVGVAVAVALAALARLVTYAPHVAPAPTAGDLDDASRIIATQSSTTPFLALLGDKALLFNEARTAFVMYAVRGRTWVALGDPVGPVSEAGGLARRFLERCDDFGGVPVFYQVTVEYLHVYADLGLVFVKLGESATVDLTGFSLEGGHAARHRQAMRRLEKAGVTFRVVEAAGVPALLDSLRAVSDDWLTRRKVAEKGFSLGFFDEAYLQRFPVAVLEHDQRVVAFANLWPGPDGAELSIDLMRYHQEAPQSAMEGLLVHLLRWGHAHGYRRFALGMAPLAGVEASPVAPLWNRIGAFMYEHGTAVYSFRGLRAYKEKFDPVWNPSYMAYPGGLRLPRILADVAATIAGGYGRIFKK